MMNSKTIEVKWLHTIESKTFLTKFNGLPFVYTSEKASYLLWKSIFSKKLITNGTASLVCGRPIFCHIWPNFCTRGPNFGHFWYVWVKFCMKLWRSIQKTVYVGFENTMFAKGVLIMWFLTWECLILVWGSHKCHFVTGVSKMHFFVSGVTKMPFFVCGEVLKTPYLVFGSRYFAKCHHQPNFKWNTE